MGTDVEHTSSHIQTTVTTPSTASTSGPKTSMFTKKLGFVIPKNKLSGSLVPVFRGTKRGDGDSVNEEATNQVQRKTKWGPDLTLDSNVRKVRALAYQARINQISQQLTLGALAMKDNQDPLSTSEFHDDKSSHHRLSQEKMEMLELERREIIGEILKLNPNYKAPADYKPLLNETKVPIPIKEYPGYNFTGLIFGPASDMQKRLEKETGAKIRVYGTKADKGGKFEVTPDGKEIDGAYEDLYVHVVADSFEKIDAAVALIELLVTPVSVNPLSTSTTSTTVSDDNVITGSSQSMPRSFVTPALINQGTAQPYAGPFPPPPQGHHLHYPQAWFPAGPTQTPIFPQSGLVTPANSSAALLGNPAPLSSSPFNPSNVPFGPRPVIPASFSSLSQNPSFVSSRPQLPHVVQPPYMQQTFLLGPTGGPGNAPQAAFSDRPLPFAGDSSIWLQSPVSTSASQDVTNIMPMTPLVPSQGNNAMASQHMVMSLLPRMNIHNNMMSPISGPSQSAGTPVGHPIGSLSYGSASQPPRSFSPLLPTTASESIPLAIHPSTIGHIHPAVPPVAMCTSSPNLMQGSTPIPFLVTSSTSLPQSGIPNSVSGNAPNFDSTKPLSNIPRPHHPSLSDFTFQPHRPHNTASQVSWQSSQPANHNLTPPIQTGLAPLAPQSPLIRPAMHNLNPFHVQGFPRPQVSHHMSQPRAQISMNLVGGPGGPLVPPRHLALPGHNIVSSPTVHHMQPRNFIPPHPIVNSAGPFPPRAANQMSLQQNHSPGANPRRFPSPHPHFSNYPGKPFSSGTQHIYDPFSPTSVSLNPQMGGNAAKLQNESDPEYEDLMASVGVK